MTFSIDNPSGGCNNPPLGKYVWEKPSGEQGLKYFTGHSKSLWGHYEVTSGFIKHAPMELPWS